MSLMAYPESLQTNPKNKNGNQMLFYIEMLISGKKLFNKIRNSYYILIQR